MAHLADSWPDSQICIKMYNAAFTLSIMAPVRDQTALLHEQRNSRITILSDLQCHFLNAVVYVRNRVLGNGPERSVKHSRQLGASRNIRETQPILCGRLQS